MDQSGKRNITIITGDDFCFRLNGMKDLPDASQVARTDLCSLVEQDEVTKLDLLDDQVFQVILSDIRTLQRLAIVKLLLKPEGIDDRHDAIERGPCFLDKSGYYIRDGTDGLGDRGRLTDAAGFDDNIIETAGIGDVAELLDEIHP